MKRLMIATVATLGLLVSAPLMAQDTGAPAAASPNAAQSAIHDRWPASDRAIFDAWPESYRSYFWTLTRPQQRAYWFLTDDQRAQLDAMTPEQRAAAWPAIEAEARRLPPRRGGRGLSRRMIVAPTVFIKNEATPVPPEALNRDYPVCSKTITDKCVNRGGK